MGIRKALPTNWLEPRTIPIGTASAVAIARPRAQPLTVWPKALQKARVCIIDQSSWNVVVIAGRSCSEISPETETYCQSARKAAIDTAAAKIGVSRARKEPRVARASPGAERADATPETDTP